MDIVVVVAAAVALAIDTKITKVVLVFKLNSHGGMQFINELRTYCVIISVLCLKLSKK